MLILTMIGAFVAGIGGGLVVASFFHTRSVETPQDD